MFVIQEDYNNVVGITLSKNWMKRNQQRYFYTLTLTSLLEKCGEKPTNDPFDSTNLTFVGTIS